MDDMVVVVWFRIKG